MSGSNSGSVPQSALRPPSRIAQFYALTKPRVVQLIVFCALIGMLLALPGLPTLADIRLALVACLGIWLVAAAAAGFGLPAAAVAEAAPAPSRPRGRFRNLRVATFNASLNRGRDGQLLEDLATGEALAL